MDCMLSGSGNNVMIGYLNKFYPVGGKTKARLKLYLGKKQQSPFLARRGECFIFVDCTI